MRDSVRKPGRPVMAALWLAVFLFVHLAPAQEVGGPLPDWSAGTLDIHHINTGRGEAALFVLPDGTTMLIDAGATASTGPRGCAQKPDSSRTPGQWIVEYIERILASRDEPVLDYALITHFHGDHMGKPKANSAVSPAGDYLLSGITEVGENIRINKILDRGWPDYNYPLPLENEMVANYRKFLDWQISHNGLVAERFTAGRGDQIVLVHDRGSYPEFSVRNIAVNGQVWTGEGSKTKNHLPAAGDVPQDAGWEDRLNENMFSTVLKLSYGKFDYYTGGDLPGYPWPGAPAWGDLETPVATVVGPVEVHVLDHHGFVDAANEFFLRTLRPRVHLIQSVGASHPTFGTYRRLISKKLYPGPREIFITNLMEVTRIVLGSTADSFASSQGHVVVRVAPGGGSYRVIVLDDSDAICRVKSVHGPYEASGGRREEAAR